MGIGSPSILNLFESDCRIEFGTIALFLIVGVVRHGHRCLNLSLGSEDTRCESP